MHEVAALAIISQLGSTLIAVQPMGLVLRSQRREVALGQKPKSPYQRGFGYCPLCRQYYPAYEVVCHIHKLRLRISPRWSRKKGKRVNID
ncbi:MAG: hypothetical protein QXU44_02420 [Candidatus Caldarchaeum sp.]